jgi:hypothetical protein
MPQVGFEFTIPVFERTKTVLALDRAAVVIGNKSNSINNNNNNNNNNNCNNLDFSSLKLKT